MLVVSFPSIEVQRLAGPLPAGVRAGVWDLRSDPVGVELDELEMVVIPHYMSDSRSWQRLATLPRLRLVQLPSAGYEHALPYIPPGVMLANGRGVHDDATSELALALILAAQRGLDEFMRAQAQGVWLHKIHPSLADRRVVVIGQGAIGQAICSRLEPFRVDLVRVASMARTITMTGPDGSAREVAVRGVAELPGLLPEAEIVVLIVPLTQATTRLVDADFLALLPDGALLVNVARGAVVDTDALLAELESGRLRAALDVTDPEPLPPEHPLWRAPGVIITPHQGGHATTANPRTAALVRAQIEAIIAGRDLVNLVGA